MGSTRRCIFHDGTHVREEVVEVHEGRQVRLRLSEFSLPMNRIEAVITVEPDGDGQTRATFAIDDEVRFGPLGKLLGATVMRRELTRMATKVVAGLAHHAATGELVGKDFVASAA